MAGPHPALRRVCAAALAYFALVFAVGFALGTLRVMVLVPRLGSEALAVALELPVMLLVSWMAARWAVERYRTARGSQCAAVGLFAFLLLMLAEAGLAVVLFGQSPGQWVATFRETSGLLGLGGQIAFAAMPWFVGQAR